MYYDVDAVDKKYAEIVASRAVQGESAQHIPQQTHGGSEDSTQIFCTDCNWDAINFQGRKCHAGLVHNSEECKKLRHA